MKRIEVWVQRRELDDVTAALRDAGVMGATATEVRSAGSGVIERTIRYRGAPYTTESFPRVKLEMVVHDDVVERLISSLALTSKNAQLCDWDIIVIQVDDAVRIRTGEIAEAAIA
jgi:nitrogen regulatory protein P-II 1